MTTETLTKQSLADELNANVPFSTKATAPAVVTAYFTALRNELLANGKVMVSGVMRLSTRHKKPRPVQAHVGTSKQKTVILPERTVVTSKACDVMRRMMRGDTVDNFRGAPKAIVAHLAEVCGLPKLTALAAVYVIQTCIRNALLNGDRVEIRGFGVFHVKPFNRGPGHMGLVGSNDTHTLVQVPRFKASTALLALLNS